MNRLITLDEMAEQLTRSVKDHAQGDPELELALWDYVSALFFST